MPVRSRRTQHWSPSPKHLHHVLQRGRQVPFLAVGNSGGMPEPATYFCALLCTVASRKDLEPDASTFLISWNKQTPEWVLGWGPGRGLACAGWITGIRDFVWIMFADTEVRLWYQPVVLLNANCAYLRSHLAGELSLLGFKTERAASGTWDRHGSSLSFFGHYAKHLCFRRCYLLTVSIFRHARISVHAFKWNMFFWDGEGSPI